MQDDFFDWLKEGGSEFDDIFFEEYDNERGVHSNKNIKKNSLVIKIPRKMIIHSNRPSKNSTLMEKLDIPNKNIHKLVLFMLEDMESGESFFQPYYDILPDDLSHFPIFWTEEELLFLENSHFIDDIINRRETFYNNYKKLSTLPDFSYTFDDYCIIRTLVGSRNFGLNINGERVIAMVPLGDMFNHDIPADVKWSFDNSLESYTMRANHSIKKGHQISDSYGKKCNSKYLLYYGFMVGDNDINCKTLVDLQYNKDIDKLSNLREPLIQANQKYLLDSNWESNNKLLSQLRIINADLGELKYIINKYSDSSIIPPISKKNEMKTLESFFEILKKEKDNYGSSIDENKLELNRNENPNKKTALQMIIREKENIKYFEKNLEKLLKNLLFETPDINMQKYLNIIKNL